MSFERSSLSAFPRPQTSLIGRAQETAVIHDLLGRSNVRLLTLTGPGGAGKTRLALHAGLTAPGFDDGRWFIELAGLSDPNLILSQIAQALGLRQRGDTGVRDQIVSVLDGRDVLMVLDNFEHLLDGATVVSQLLSLADGFKLMITSRAPLNLAHEHLVPVGALEIDPPPGDATHGEAVELFLQRSRAIRAGYDPNPADLKAIAAICAELSGLPLAIELAAARTRVMAPQALLSRLSQPLRILSAGPHDAPARHRSMRDAIDWSYRLLPGDQRALLRAMGVFAGLVPLDGLDMVAAQAGIAEPDETIELVARLADASMIESIDRDPGVPRFLVYATVREFVLEELERAGELEDARAHHARWMESLATELATQFEGPREHLAFARLQSELDNLRAALHWSLERGEIERAARISGELGSFWSFGGHSSEGRFWIDRIEPLLDDADLPPHVRFRFWEAAGLTAWAQGDAQLAQTRYARALEIAQGMHDRAAESYGWLWLSQAVWYTGDYTAMRDYARRALAIAAPNSASLAGSQTLFGVAEMRLGNLDAAEHALITARERHAVAGYTRGAVWTLQLLGDLAFLRGNFTASARAHRESMTLGLNFNHIWAVFEAWSGLIAIALKLGWTAEALELLAGAERLLTTSSIRPREGAWLSDEDRLALKAVVDPADFEQLSQTVATRSVPDLVARATQIALAMESPSRSSAPPRPVAARRSAARSAFDLSAREQEVLSLMVQGKTDRQIAETLGVSHGTARSHVAHVLQKLDARNRAVAVRKALELALV